MVNVASVDDKWQASAVEYGDALYMEPCIIAAI